MLTIFSLPSPLHPAVVHFPIVLILLGAVVAVAAVFTRRWHLPGFAATLLFLGAVGSLVAAQTGKHEGELVGEAALASLLDQHENWAERTRTTAIVAALLAIGAAATSRWPRARQALGVSSAVTALVVTWCVAQTGHYGGQLVYRHGAGVNLTPAAADVSTGKTAGENKTRRTHDND